MRILHLAFEDHRRPGSGGGGIRTREINRRLAGRHQITVLTSRYPGAAERVEDGVRYRPIGFGSGHLLTQATYHLALPFHVAASRVDLVVEDFAAPVSSTLVPLWTRRPTLAVVQWLAARETSRRYRLPFFLFEELGMRLHRRFVAVSGTIADRLRAANPDADIRVVYAGVDADPRPAGPRNGRRDGPRRVLYLGRIELEPKGLDLLVQAARRLARRRDDVRFVVAGDGPHRDELARLIEANGLGDRFDLVGRVDGEAKWDLLGQADVLAVTSRYESFGLVAAEALRAGTPVVAFDLPSLREIVPDGAGELVRQWDTGAFADALDSTLARVGARNGSEAAERAALEVARRFDWDAAAAAQEQAYLDALETARRPLRARAARSP